MKMECSICLESLQVLESQLRCGHSFHTACIEPWLNSRGTCPNCRFQEHEPTDTIQEFLDFQLFVHAWRQIVLRTPSPPPPPTPNSYEIGCAVADTQVTDITETSTHFQCAIAGEFYQAEKRDITILRDETRDSLERCLYFFRQNEGDIVNTILEMTT